MGEKSLFCSNKVGPELKMLEICYTEKKSCLKTQKMLTVLGMATY
jgi:hypothetical protein